MKLSEKYRSPVNWGINFVTAAGVVTSFFTLPTAIAVALSIGGVLTSWVAKKLIFVSKALIIHDGMEMVFGDASPLGTCWGNDDINGIEVPCLGIVFDNRRGAQLAYATFRTWNYGKYLDHGGNINLTIVDEGEGKYSMFVYAGERSELSQAVKESVLEDLGPNSQVEVAEIRFFHKFCLDYSHRPDMVQFVENLRSCDAILLGTYYLDKEVLKAYAKRKFRLNSYKYISRSEIIKGCIEFGQEWENNKEKFPTLAHRFSKVKLNDEQSIIVDGQEQDPKDP